MPRGPEPDLVPWIETFRSRSRLDLQPLWRWDASSADGQGALGDPWARLHRPDWHARGLIVWPRGGMVVRLVLELVCPGRWRGLEQARARLALGWWAESARLSVDGSPVHHGDLFDAACRWALPGRWWRGEPLALQLELRSPLHDEGALLHSRIELEPAGGADPCGLLVATGLELEQLRRVHGRQPVSAVPSDAAAAEALGRSTRPSPGHLQLLGHAHLDLAWLWPVADTWQAAERTFESVLGLMERDARLHFGHSTPALYAWVERHRPALFARIRQAMRAGRWEPLNGPWVETDAVLIGTASLLRQFQDGQAYSLSTFPEWEHDLAWLPDSFGFAAGVPVAAATTGVRWFCTHKLAWNATNPFPHRLFRWRARCGAEVLALMTAPIGTSGDPVAIEKYRLDWQAASGVADALWLPGVGDHGGGPTAELLEQLALWEGQPVTAPQRHGTLRDYLQRLEPLRPHLPVWRDELYLELHRGCATSRPDQKRHNRSLERLLREADLAAALLWADGGAASTPPVDWSTLLFQQFHDILPGTSVPEVFEQAEPQWRQARRQARRQRDAALTAWCSSLPGQPSGASAAGNQIWWLAALQPLPSAPLTFRLPRGDWWLDAQPLPTQAAPTGGSWVQIPAAAAAGAWVRSLRQVHGVAVAPARHTAVANPVQLERLDGDDGRWRLGNGLVWAQLGSGGIEQLWGADHQPQLSAPLEWRRWRDRGEFWDAWDLAADYREHPLPLDWTGGPEVAEAGPLCCRIVWRGCCGRSPLRLDLQLLAGTPWLELTLRVDWRQRHELLRLELPLQHAAVRWAADTPGGVIERAAAAVTAREASRWEAAAISWTASQTAAGGLAVLLDGPQGVSCSADRLGVSLLRAPTWPDPGADNGPQRLRMALMPCAAGWRQTGVAAAALRFREPLWRRPATTGLVAQDILQLGSPDLQLVGLRPDPEPAVVRLTVINLSPCRRLLDPGESWRVVERIDGLGRPRTGGVDLPGGACAVLPWQLASWRIRRS